ncbi:F-box/WD repeat-containing protein pof1, partial [Stegodyphus mimosarum]
MECIASVEDTFLNNGTIKKDDHLLNNMCENGSFDTDKSDFNNFSKNCNENLLNGSSANSESDDLCESTQISNLQTIPQEQTSRNLQTVSQEQTIKISSHAINTFVRTDNSVSSSLMQEEPAKENTDQLSSQTAENADLKIQSSEKFSSSDFSSEKGVQQSVPQEQSSSSQEVSTQDMTTKEFIEKVLKPQKKPKDFEIENITSSDLEVTQLVGHADVIFSVAVDEDFVISSSADTTIKVWNVHGGKEVSSFAGHSDVVTSIVLLNARHSQKLSTLLKWGQVLRIVVTASSDCHIKLWSLLNGKELLSMYTYNGITSMDYFPCELGMIIGTDGGKLELWDIVSAKVISSVCAHEASVSGIKVEEPYIYTCSGDGTVRVWLLDEKEIQPLYIRRRKEPSSDESFKPSQWKTLDISGDTIYLGDNSNTLKVLDWRMGDKSEKNDFVEVENHEFTDSNKDESEDLLFDNKVEEETMLEKQ